MSYFVTGTDTDVGKTIVCSWLMLQNKDFHYWKPIQAGQDERDIDIVKRITGLEEVRFLPSAYDLKQALSPHEAARREGGDICLNQLALPDIKKPIIVEGAGGLLVPINKRSYMVDLIKRLGLPVILVARSGLGTLNHTFMSLEILRARGIKIKGVVLNGDLSPHNRSAIEEYGNVDILVELPTLAALEASTLEKIPAEKKIS